MTAPCGCGTYGYENNDDAGKLWQEKRVGATRTEHNCGECGEVIPVGSRCCKAWGLYDQKWEAWYRCVSCAVLAEYVAEQTKTCPLWGDLADAAFEAGVDFYVYRTTGRFSLYDTDEEETA